jgi:plasmid stability protein
MPKRLFDIHVRVDEETKWNLEFLAAVHQRASAAEAASCLKAEAAGRVAEFRDNLSPSNPLASGLQRETKGSRGK